MEKKLYKGLTVKFIPTDGMNVVTASGCEIISVQYYVTYSLGECDSKDPTQSGEIGYNYNWNNRPTGWPGL